MDWSEADRGVRVERRDVEVLGPLTGAYRAMHGGRLVECGAWDYLERDTGDPDSTRRVSEDDIADLEWAPLRPVGAVVDGEPGVARIVGEPLVLEGDQAAMMLAAFAGAGGFEIGTPQNGDDVVVVVEDPVVEDVFDPAEDFEPGEPEDGGEPERGA